MHPIPMTSGGVSVKKCVGTGGTGQFCAQMGLMHMRVYGCSGGGRSLCTPLDTTLINSFGVTHIDSQRLHLSWYCFLFRLRNGQVRAPYTDTPPLGLGTIALDL